MLYSAEIMEKICIDMLPFGKDVNLLISSFITTSDHISSILIKKMAKTEYLIYIATETLNTSIDGINDLINRRYTTQEDLRTIEKLYKLIKYSETQLIKYINQLRKFKYTKDKGEKCNYNYFKLKSKMEEKIYNSA